MDWSVRYKVERVAGESKEEKERLTLLKLAT